MSVLFVMGMGLFLYKSGYYKVLFHLERQKESRVRLGIKQGISLKTYSVIFSTPTLKDINNDGIIDVNVGTMSSGSFAYDGRTGRQIYSFGSVKEVIAAPICLDVNDDGYDETLWVAKKGKIYVVNQNGDYLYMSKPEHFNEEIHGKPALSSDKNLIYIAGMKGSVWCLTKAYGLPKWIYRNHHRKPVGIFASPLLVNVNGKTGKNKSEDVILVDLSGKVFCLDGADGRLLWEVSVRHPVKASMTYGKFLQTDKQGQIAIFGLGGSVSLISLEGKLLSQVLLSEIHKDFKGYMIGSGVAVDLLKLGYHQIVNVSSKGTVFLYDGMSGRIRKQFVPKKATVFRSSPIGVHLNDDNTYDIIAVSARKELFFIDGKTFSLMIPPQALSSPVTASPVIADLDKDGVLELVITGEDGTLTFYHLTTLKRKFDYFYKREVKEFLLNAQNHNKIN